jgi:hypothetical protein
MTLLKATIRRVSEKPYTMEVLEAPDPDDGKFELDR